MHPSIRSCRAVIIWTVRHVRRLSTQHNPVPIQGRWGSQSATFRSPSASLITPAGPEHVKDMENNVRELCQNGALTEAVAIIEQSLKVGSMKMVKPPVVKLLLTTVLDAHTQDAAQVPEAIVATVMRACTDARAVDLCTRLIACQGMQGNSVEIGEAVVELGDKAGSEAALRVFRAAEAAGVPLNTHVHMAVINTCARAGHFDEVERVLKDLRGSGLKLNHRQYSAALSAFHKLERWRESLDLMKEMRLAGVTPDKGCYLHVIATCLRVGEWQPAIDLARSYSTYNETLDWARSEEGNYSVEALPVQLKSAMHAAELRPTLHIAEMILEELSILGHVKQSVLLLEEMRQAYHLQVNTRHFASTLRAGRNSEPVNVNVTLALLKTMQKMTTMHPLLYVEAMKVCLCGAKFEEVLKLEGDMRQRGLPIKGQSEILVLKALFKVGRRQEALARLDSPACTLPFPHLYGHVLGPKPSVEHIEAAITAILGCLRLARDDHEKYMSHMRQAVDLCVTLADGLGWSPDLLDAMRRLLGEERDEVAQPLAHLLEQVMATLSKKPRNYMPFQSRNPKKNFKFVNFVLEVYASTGRWRQALRLLEHVRIEGPKPGVGCVASTIAACSAAGRMDEAFEVMRQADLQVAATASNVYSVVIPGCRTRPLVALYLLEELRCRGGRKGKATVEVLKGLYEDKVLFDLFAAHTMIPFFEQGGLKGFAVSIEDGTMKVDLHKADPCVVRAALLRILNDCAIIGNVRLYVGPHLEAKKAIFEVLEGQAREIPFEQQGERNQYVVIDRKALEAFRAAMKASH